MINYWYFDEHRHFINRTLLNNAFEDKDLFHYDKVLS